MEVLGVSSIEEVPIMEGVPDYGGVQCCLVPGNLVIII